MILVVGNIGYFNTRSTLHVKTKLREKRRSPGIRNKLLFEFLSNVFNNHMNEHTLKYSLF